MRTMETYKLIIKNIAHCDINFFNQDTTHNNVNTNIRLAFGIMYELKLTVVNKFKFFDNTINGLIIKGHESDFIDYFCRIQKTYNILNRLVKIYKYKRTKIVSNTDMYLNTLNVNDNNVICIVQNNSKYLFRIHDLIKIIDTSLVNSYMFFAQPLPIKNPYSNIPFNKSDLYNIYFFIRYKTDLYSELYFRFFRENFNINCFKYKNEYILREYSIRNFVYTSPENTLVTEIMTMINYYNIYCNKYNLQSKLNIDADFPKNKMIKIFQPYLLLHMNTVYGMIGFEREQMSILFIRSMRRFYKFNPKFGRKIIKLFYKPGIGFKRKICGKQIEFDDKHIKFLDVAAQKERFLDDHLETEHSVYRGVIDNSYEETDEPTHDTNDSDTETETAVYLNNTDNHDSYSEDEDSVS